MFSKIIVLCLSLAVANAAPPQAPVNTPSVRYSPASEVSHVYSSSADPASLAVGTTQQSVSRSFEGTVSQYSKAVDTPFSSVRKVDTRVNNNVYTPAFALTAHSPALTYAAGPAYYTHAAHPAYYTHSAHPGVSAKTITYSAAVAPVAHVIFDGYGIHYAY